MGQAEVNGKTVFTDTVNKQYSDETQPKLNDMLEQQYGQVCLMYMYTQGVLIQIFFPRVRVCRFNTDGQLCSATSGGSGGGCQEVQCGH